MSRRWRNEPFDRGIQVGANDIDPEFGVTRRRIERLRRAIEGRQPDLHLVLEEVDDPHNVSAVLRTCDAVGVGTVHFVYADGRIPRLGKASSASAWKWMEIEHHASISACYQRIRGLGCFVVATDLSDRAELLYDLNLSRPVALVFGNEHRGVSPEASRLADTNLLIPMTGLIQSLNISVACAVVLYEAMRQRLADGRYDSPSLTEESIHALLAEWARR